MLKGNKKESVTRFFKIFILYHSFFVNSDFVFNLNEIIFDKTVIKDERSKLNELVFSIKVNTT